MIRTSDNTEDEKQQEQKSAVELPHPTAEVNSFLVHGLLLMERGYIFTCMILAAVSACLIDRKFVAAGTWMLCASVLTFLGAMHSYQVYKVNAGDAFDFLFRFLEPWLEEFTTAPMISLLVTCFVACCFLLWLGGQNLNRFSHMSNSVMGPKWN